MMTSVAHCTYRYKKGRTVYQHMHAEESCAGSSASSLTAALGTFSSVGKGPTGATVAVWVFVTCLLHPPVGFSYPHFHHSSIDGFVMFWQPFAPDLSDVGRGVWECEVLPSIMAHGLGHSSQPASQESLHAFLLQNPETNILAAWKKKQDEESSHPNTFQSSNSKEYKVVPVHAMRQPLSQLVMLPQWFHLQPEHATRLN